MLAFFSKKTTSKLISYDELQNTNVVTQLAVSDTKIVAQTVHSLVLIEPKSMVDIQTFRPVSCGVLGTRMLSLGKYGPMVTFSTAVRNVKMVLKLPADKDKRELSMTAWYRGLWMAPDASQVGILYADGYVRRVKV